MFELSIKISIKRENILTFIGFYEHILIIRKHGITADETPKTIHTRTKLKVRVFTFKM